MDIKEIQAIAKAMKENDLTLLRLNQGETTLYMERGNGQTGAAMAAPAPAAAPAPVSAPAAAAEGSTQGAAPPLAAEAAEAGNTVDFNRLALVKSPMVGVFYAAPSPDSPPFVQVGSKVKKGDVLCIIEAMKLMNEICADRDGEIVDICVANGDVVEFSQVLFKLF